MPILATTSYCILACAFICHMAFTSGELPINSQPAIESAQTKTFEHLQGFLFMFFAPLSLDASETTM